MIGALHATAVFVLWAGLAFGAVVEPVVDEIMLGKGEQPPGELIIGPSPIGKWENIDVNLAGLDEADLAADPSIQIILRFEISEDGKSFKTIAQSTIHGGKVDRGNKQYAPPGFLLMRSAIPDDWWGQIRVTSNKTLSFGTSAKPEKK